VRSESAHARIDRFLEVGIWFLFFALLVPAGFAGYEIGLATSHSPAAHVERAP
jgi:hypothetical protein